MSKSDGSYSDTTKTMSNQNKPEKYFMKIDPPKIIDATIVVKPPSKGGLEEGKKDLLSKKVKDVEESIKHGLHLESKEI
ncbi:MAG TPA: hypothetical protein VFY41_08585 [Nitrososphaeraceae archaeon]|nr:hypothetical protein [Nitrososphaeraceae archaeon]